MLSFATRLFLGVTLCSISIQAACQQPGAVTTTGIDLLGKKWLLKLRCAGQQDLAGFLSFHEQERSTVRGCLTWTVADGKITELLVGTIDHQSGRLYLRARESRSRSQVARLGVYHATVARDGRVISDGTWSCQIQKAQGNWSAAITSSGPEQVADSPRHTDAAWRQLCRLVAPMTFANGWWVRRSRGEAQDLEALQPLCTGALASVLEAASRVAEMDAEIEATRVSASEAGARRAADLAKIVDSFVRGQIDILSGAGDGYADALRMVGRITDRTSESFAQLEAGNRRALLRTQSVVLEQMLRDSVCNAMKAQVGVDPPTLKVQTAIEVHRDGVVISITNCGPTQITDCCVVSRLQPDADAILKEREQAAGGQLLTDLFIRELFKVDERTAVAEDAKRDLYWALRAAQHGSIAYCERLPVRATLRVWVSDEDDVATAGVASVTVGGSEGMVCLPLDIQALREAVKKAADDRAARQREQRSRRRR